MSPISHASRLAEFGSGIGTHGAIIQVDNTNKRVGIGTTNPQAMLQVGTAISMFGSTGIVSATTFTGSGANLTSLPSAQLTGALPAISGANLTGVVGVGTLNVRTETITASGVSTFTGALNATSVVSSGAVSGTTGTFSAAVSGTTGTFSAAVSGTTGTFSGAVNVDATTDSTSSTSGALIVDGGLGIAKNVYIGAGLSVAGTLTYEDVTNVDSVGLITAKSGVNVSGGQLLVGSGITMGIAGVATFSGTSDVHLLDNVKLNIGDGPDLQLSHSGTNSVIDNNTGGLYIRNNVGGDVGGDIYIQAKSGENSAIFTHDGSAALHFNNAKKFETTNDGTVTTGIGTFAGAISLTSGGAERLNIASPSGGNLVIKNPSNAYLSFGTNDTERLRITSDGKVGINSVPGYTLDMIGDQIRLRSNSSGSNAVLRLWGQDASTGGAIISQNNTGGAAPLYFLYVTNPLSHNFLSISVKVIKGSPIIAVGSLLLISSKRVIPKPSDFILPTQLKGFSCFK